MAPESWIFPSNCQMILRTVIFVSTCRNLLTNPATNEYYKVGEKMKRPKYAATLRVIAREGATSFYNGSLMRTIVKEIKDAGKILRVCYYGCGCV